MNEWMNEWIIEWCFGSRFSYSLSVHNRNINNNHIRSTTSWTCAILRSCAFDGCTTCRFMSVSKQRTLDCSSIVVCSFNNDVVQLTEYGVRSTVCARSLKSSNVAPVHNLMGDRLGLQVLYTLVGLREPRKSDGSSDWLWVGCKRTPMDIGAVFIPRDPKKSTTWRTWHIYKAMIDIMNGNRPC